jgi:ATP-dependent DNA helicase RecG
MIEQWGGGIGLMRQACREAGIPEPQFEEYQGFRVTFRKDLYTEEYLRSLSLNGRQIKAIMYVKKKGEITNKEYQTLCNTIKRTASRDLSHLVSVGLFNQIGTGTRGRGIKYVLAPYRDIKGT